MRHEITDFERAAIGSFLPNKPRGIPRVEDRRVLFRGNGKFGPVNRYSVVNARNSSRATSLKSLSRSIPDPLCANSCNSRIVLLGRK
jgi:hypothetical protein